MCCFVLQRPYLSGAQHYHSHQAHRDIDHPFGFPVERQAADLWGSGLLLPGLGILELYHPDLAELNDMLQEVAGCCRIMVRQRDSVRDQNAFKTATGAVHVVYVVWLFGTTTWSNSQNSPLENPALLPSWSRLSLWTGSKSQGLIIHSHFLLTFVQLKILLKCPIHLPPHPTTARSQSCECGQHKLKSLDPHSLRCLLIIYNDYRAPLFLTLRLFFLTLPLF
jgi:hypothetical protein